MCKNNCDCESIVFAAHRNHDICIRSLLMNGHDVNIHDHYGFHGLHVAKNLSCLKRLLEVNCDPNVLGLYDMTPLHSAVSHPKNIIELLKFGANIKNIDYFGNTALHDAVKVGCIESVNILLEAGSNINIKNVNGYTPYALGIDSNIERRVKCTELIKKHRINSVYLLLLLGHLEEEHALSLLPKEILWVIAKLSFP